MCDVSFYSLYFSVFFTLSVMNLHCFIIHLKRVLLKKKKKQLPCPGSHRQYVAVSEPGPQDSRLHYPAPHLWVNAQTIVSLSLPGYGCFAIFSLTLLHPYLPYTAETRMKNSFEWR